MKKTVLVIPPNDPEAILIYELAKAMGIQIIRSSQPHGATLEKETDLVPLIRDGEWKRVVIVEMPGLNVEAKLRKMGVEVVIIDHHQYTGIDRAKHPKTGKLLPSSLEQFLKLFRITDIQLRKFGYTPKIARGIGVMDRGYVWALQEEGYRQLEIETVIALQRALLLKHGLLKDEDRKMKQTKKAWKNRKMWNEYFIVTSNVETEIRSRVSMIVVQEIGKPTPIIFLEKKRGLIYVQESPRAMDLFRQFGGFTFGGNRNWGYRNEKGKRQVTLQEVKNILV